MKMLRRFYFWEGPQASMYQQMLDAEGVACLVKNANLVSALGEIPFMECSPEIWVIDDEVYPRARLLLDAWLEGTADSEEQEWRCSGCGELVAAQFSVCWNCFQARD